MNNYTNLYFKYPQNIFHLEELGFKILSSCDGDTYLTYRFPCEYWHRKNGAYVPTLFCTLTVSTDTWHVIVDVRTIQDDYYPDFYSQEYGNPEPLLGNVRKRIDKELAKLKIVEKKKPRKKKGVDDDERKATGSRESNTRTARPIKRRQNRQTGENDTGNGTKTSWKSFQKEE